MYGKTEKVKTKKTTKKKEQTKQNKNNNKKNNKKTKKNNNNKMINHKFRIFLFMQSGLSRVRAPANSSLLSDNISHLHTLPYICISLWTLVNITTSHLSVSSPLQILILILTHHPFTNYI